MSVSLRLGASAFLLASAFSSPAAALPPGRAIQLQDVPQTVGFLSPPRVARPYYLCSDVVYVDGAVPHATVELEGDINGQSIQLSATASWFGSVTFRLPRPIETTSDWFITRQDDGVDQSASDADPTDPSIRALEPPNPAPPPSVYWGPHYKCGVRAGVTAFLRSADVSLIGHGPSSWETLFTASKVAYHAVEGVSRGYEEGEQLQGRYEFCQSGPFARFGSSERVEVQPYPRETIAGQPGQWRPQAPPTPTLEIVEGFPFAFFGNLWHGATLELFDASGTVVGTGATASPTAHVAVGFTPGPSGDFQPKQSFPRCPAVDPFEGSTSSRRLLT